MQLWSEWKWFSKVFLKSHGNINHRGMKILPRAPPDGLNRSTKNEYTLEYLDFFIPPLFFLHYPMYCKWWMIKTLLFLYLKISVWNLLMILLTIWHKALSHNPFLLKHLLWCMLLLYPTPTPLPVTLTAESYKKAGTPIFLCPSPNLLLVFSFKIFNLFTFSEWRGWSVKLRKSFK